MDLQEDCRGLGVHRARDLQFRLAQCGSTVFTQLCGSGLQGFRLAGCWGLDEAFWSFDSLRVLRCSCWDTGCSKQDLEDGRPTSASTTVQARQVEALPKQCIHMYMYIYI